MFRIHNGNKRENLDGICKNILSRKRDNVSINDESGSLTFIP